MPKEILEQYFLAPAMDVMDVHTSIRDFSLLLAMSGRSSNREEQNNEWLDVRTIGNFVFYVIDFGKMPEGGALPFAPQKNICGVCNGGIFEIGTDRKFYGNLDGMGYAFSFEDRK